MGHGVNFTFSHAEVVDSRFTNYLQFYVIHILLIPKKLSIKYCDKKSDLLWFLNNLIK